MSKYHPPEISYDDLPASMRESVRKYVEHGVDPGRFARDVLENNFLEALLLADRENLSAISGWARWLSVECPARCCGDHKTVVEWMRGGGMTGFVRRMNEEDDGA